MGAPKIDPPPKQNPTPPPAPPKGINTKEDAVPEPMDPAALAEVRRRLARQNTAVQTTAIPYTGAGIQIGGR